MTTAEVIARPAKYPRGKHPNTLASIKRFAYKPGENGHGRVYPLKERLQHLLDKPYTELIAADRMKLKVGDVLALSTMEGAIHREPAPFREVWDRVEGKLTDSAPPPAQVITVIEVVIDNSKKG